MQIEPNHASPDDQGRLAALRATGLLDSPAEQGFDDIVRLAARMCATPVALVSLVDADRQWFKARINFPDAQTDLERSVCKFALSEPDLLIIPDLTADPRTAANPLVTGAPSIRFYAGAPLRVRDGHVLGSLCVIDTVPRPNGLDDEQADDLRALARHVSDLIELRRTAGVERITQATAVSDAARLEAMISTQQVVASAVADLDTIFDAVVMGALRVIDAATGAVVEIREGDELVYRTTAGSLAPYLGTRLPLSNTMSGKALLEETPLHCPDTEANPNIDHAMARGLDIRSMIAVPVFRHGVAIGVLKVSSVDPQAFSARDILMTQMLAGLVASGFGEVAEAQTRRALREAESRYKAIFDSATDFAIVAADAKGMITDWNAGATEIMGWSEDAVRHRPLATFFTPEDQHNGVPEREMRLARTNGTAMDERWHARESGERFWAVGRMMALLHEDGAPRGYLKILQDRTLQRNAATKQQADAKFMRSVLSSSADCIKVLDLDGSLTFMSEGGLQVMEISDFNLVKGCPWPDFWQGQGNADAVAALAAAKEGGIGHFQGFANTYLGSPRWWDVQVTPILGTDGRPEKILSISRDITDQKTVEGRLASSEARWRGLFNGMQEGFFLGELIRDADGRAADYRFLEINPAFARQSGLSADSIGRTIRELVPDIEQWLIDRYASVIETGEPTAFEIDVPSLNRSFEVRANKEQDERFGCLFLDITERRQADARRTAMTELGDRLRDAATVLDMTTSAAEIVGRTLKATRAGYGELDAAGEYVTILWDGPAPGEASIVGRHRFADYGEVAPSIERGDPVAVSDVVTDPRTASNAATYAAISLRAMLNVPVQERGRTVGLIFVHNPNARIWTPEEVAFARNVADRVQVGIARLRAEERQAVLNHELSHRMKNLLAMVQSIAAQTMRGATDVTEARDVLSGRLIALGKAHDLLLGSSVASTRLGAVVREAVRVHQDHPDRFAIVGSDIEIGADQALAVSLSLHELATNAAKYGALKTEAGCVAIGWETIQNGSEPSLRLSWAESGGPTVRPPTRKGFGSRFLERALAAQVGGEMVLAYPESGVTFALTAPLSAFQRTR